MKITIVCGEQEFYSAGAERIAAAIRTNPEAKIGLSTGRTTKGVHAALVKLCEEREIDCSRITVFGIDEITNMPRSCPASCYDLLLNQVVRPLRISEDRFLMPDPEAEDPLKECQEFERRVMENGGPDFIFLGLGENGHLGFNQPGTPFGRTAWLSWMDDSLDERLRRENGIPADVKMGGLTLGIKNLMQCPHLVLAANGSNKADSAAGMIEGPVTEALPASVLQLHPDCEVILDADAAQNLSRGVTG